MKYFECTASFKTFYRIETTYFEGTNFQCPIINEIFYSAPQKAEKKLEKLDLSLKKRTLAIFDKLIKKKRKWIVKYT